jgi:predicted O-methyltransferase YrrM
MNVGDSTAWIYWNRNIDDYGLRSQITLHRKRMEDFTGDIKDIGVAFVDGNHDSGHTYETLKKVKNYLADEAIIIVDDFEIHGGAAQTPYPGYPMDLHSPVKTDTNRFIRENPEISIIGYSPWLHWQIYLLFRRR